MHRFTQFPQWIIPVFSLFCLFQVRNWFEETLEAFSAASRSFVFRDRKYLILPNRSFIIDESLKAYGVQLNYNHYLN